MDKEKMTEEELREKIAELLLDNISVFKCNNQAFSNTYLYDQLANGLAGKILTITKQYYREAGWKSPEEVQELEDKIDWLYEREAGASI